MIIKADAGYNVIIMRRPEGRTVWDAAHAIRIPVVAWEYYADGMMRPCLPYPSSTDDYVIELPSGVVVGYSARLGNTIWADDLTAWLAMVRSASLAGAEVEGNA